MTDLYYVRKAQRVRAWQWNGQPIIEWPDWLTLETKKSILAKAIILGTFVLDTLQTYAPHAPRNNTLGPELFHATYDPEPVEMPDEGNDAIH